MPSFGIVDGRMLPHLHAFYPSLCTIEKATEGRDGLGDVTETWAALLQHEGIPCALGPAGGGEQKRPEGILERATHRIALRGHFPDVKPKMRAVIGTVKFDILLATHDSQAESTYLDVEVVT